MLFYYSHLENVSRSFSMCIMQLKPPENQWVALSYLLFRVIDTIEDSQWPDEDQQFEAFRQLKTFFSDTPSQEVVDDWLQVFPKDIPAGEKNLLADLPRLLLDLKTLPPNIESQLIKTMLTMMDGMQHFLVHHKNNNQRVLPSLTATNHYCFFVAGIVGELLTHIFTSVIPGFEGTDILFNQSLHFGLFLQKINILKDQAFDESVGHYYVSSRSELRDSLIINAEETINYILMIPISSGRSYRLFCAWSLFLGLASLKWIDKSFINNAPCKISHRETVHLMNQVKQMLDNNDALVALFNRYHPRTQSSAESKVSNDPQASLPDWFCEIYLGDSAKINHQLLGLSESKPVSFLGRA